MNSGPFTKIFEFGLLICPNIGSFKPIDPLLYIDWGEKKETINVKLKNKIYTIKIQEIEINTKTIPGLSVMSNDNITVALDISLNDNLKEEGLARELINRIQNIRKNKKLEVIDKINVFVKCQTNMTSCINNNLSYICQEILADKINFVKLTDARFENIILINGIELLIKIEKNTK